MLRTHYDNLQVARNASESVIRAAYKTLAQQWHPDKHADKNERAERITTIINEAYRVLSDPELRKEHDEWIAQQEAEAELARNPSADTSSIFKRDDIYSSNSGAPRPGDQGSAYSNEKREREEPVWDKKTCPKCDYERQPSDHAPQWQCPSCGVAYAKVLRNGRPLAERGKLLAALDDFELCEHCFFYKGARHELSEISSVRGGRIQDSINFVPINKYSSLGIALNDGTEISFEEHRTFFGGSRHRKITELLSLVRKVTFQSRLKFLMRQLGQRGFLELYRPINIGGISDGTEEETIYLFKEGVIKSASRSLDIKKARASGTFSLGTRKTAILGSSYETNPGEVAISLNRPVLGDYLPRDALKFTPYLQDPDVAFALLDWLSKPGNNL